MISRGYTGLGDFSNFEGKMKDSGKRKLVYDHLMQDDYFSEIGDFSKFESALRYKTNERKNYNFMMQKGWCDIITGKPDKKVCPELFKR